MLLPEGFLITYTRTPAREKRPHKRTDGRKPTRTRDPIMAVTVRTSDALRRPTTGTHKLSYTLELLIDLDVPFDPYETKVLNTGVKATPHTACILFCTKISSASSPPHAVDFVAVGPNERSSNDYDSSSQISVEVTNPSSKILLPQETPLRLILFALPLAPVRPGLLWIQKKAEDPRGRPRFPISILAVIPSVNSLDIELVATGLCWKPYPRDQRLTTVISLDMFKADIRRYTTAQIRSCTQKGVYVHEVMTTQATGNVYITLLTREGEVVPPSSLVLRITFHGEETPETATTFSSMVSTPSLPSQKWIAFNTSPDPTFYIPHSHGITITCPKNVHLFPGHQSRIEISVSFCSEQAHLGLFIPSPRDNVSCQITAWREKRVLSLVVTATVSTDLYRGELLGTAYFLPSNTLRVRKTTPPIPTSKYTALLTELRDPPDKHRRSDDLTSRRDTPISGERNFWSEYPPPEARKKRPHAETLYSEYPIAYPKPSATIETPGTSQGDPFSDGDETLEIYPCGTIFKLKQLIPLILEESNERRGGSKTGGHRGPPKKIGTVTTLQLRGTWTPGKKTEPRRNARLAWRDIDAKPVPEL